jgi:hypothetical protein
MWRFTIDDALISIRYARHLASGVGYRFNVGGLRTDGVTPLPWSFLLAPFAHAPALVVLHRAKLLAFSAWIAAAWRWGSAVGRARASLAIKVTALLLLAACLPVGAHAISGMETGLAIALATLAAVEQRPILCAALAGAVASLRPEMVAWAAVLAMFSGDARRAALRAFIAFLPFSACALVREIAFGRPAPLAVLAKPSDLAHGAYYAAAAAIMTLAPLAALAPVALARAEPRARALALAGVTHFAAIAVAGGDWMPYARLAAPIVPSLLYAFVLAAPRMNAPLVACRVVLSGLVGACVLVRIAPAGRHVEDHMAALVRAAEPILARKHRIASLDVGWPTAASEADIVDLAGLTDPEIAALPGGHTSKRVDPALLLARNPDVILLYWRRVGGEHVYGRVVEARLAESDLIFRHYEARATLPSFGEDDAGYDVLMRRDTPVTD